MKYHPCGAIIAVDSAGDGKRGLFDEDGAMRVAIDDGGHGIYDATGAIRVHDASADVGVGGIYDPTGAWRELTVSGLTLVGIYSPTGAFNLFFSSAPVLSFYLLQEDGFKITLEDGSGFLLLEAA